MTFRKDDRRGCVFVALVCVLFICRCVPDDFPLQKIVDEFVEQHPEVHNCVAVVSNSDGSQSWYGAAGTAFQEENTVMTGDTPIYLASITKMYTAVVILSLCEQGALSLDDRLSHFLPADTIKGIAVVDGKDYSGEISVRQLLSHTSGIADFYSERGKDGKTAYELYLENPGRCWTVDWNLARTKTLPGHFPPGTGVWYSDANYILLGKIAERVSGSTLCQLYQTFIISPLSLRHTWLAGSPSSPSELRMRPADVWDEKREVSVIRENGSYWADGGLISTPEDCLVFFKALNNGRLISEKSLRIMEDWKELNPYLEYGCGLMRLRAENLCRYRGHFGSTGSFLLYCE
ncbi:MAG TPA: class A beta-lactamase-related serine hydrolase, partial [Spirochaetia bacterium]|nr:class A beta-lactamase-related serine hydrolase [Spirochaetia bacterium]